MSRANNIRVLITDDSRVAREVLRSILEREGDISIVAEAENGRQAVELTRQLQPDLVTMDLNMPVMDGLAAIEEIMYSRGVPILVVSDQSDAETAYQALEYGALEIMSKPQLEDASVTSELADRVRLLAGVSVITRLRRRPGRIAHQEVPRASPTGAFATDTPRKFRHVFAVACSTGGPQALAKVLAQLEAPFPAPILVAQHISDGFIEGMAQWLATLCPLPVSVARDDEALQAGHVYLSPSEHNLSVSRHHRLRLEQRSPGDIYHPSCDVLLSSVAEVYGRDAIGIIMTGMGRDGALGMGAIHRRGGVTLAQDEASSVIYGMNQEAVNAGVIQRQVPLERLAQAMHAYAHPASGDNEAFGASYR